MHKSFTHAKCHAKSNREADNALEGHTRVLLYSFFRQHTPTLLSCIFFPFLFTETYPPSTVKAYFILSTYIHHYIHVRTKCSGNIVIYHFIL